MIKVTVSGGQIAVRSPYNTNFVAEARRLGGKWRAPDWVFDARNEAAVRAACRAAYGTDGISSAELVSVRIRFGRNLDVLQGPVALSGRPLVSAAGRDSGARTTDGVILEAGRIFSGGSARNWRTCVEAGSALLVHDVPREHADAIVACGTLHGSPVTADIVPVAAVMIDTDFLRAERERCVARIGEIDALLGDTDSPIVSALAAGDRGAIRSVFPEAQARAKGGRDRGPLLRCPRCDATGYGGAYPFSTVAPNCDDCN